MDNIPISEIFCSIQAEGKNVGMPSIFIRVWGCNLRCKFNGQNCDTPYAVITEQDKATMMTEEAIIKKVKEYYPIQHLVITGGEPQMYQKFFGQLIKDLFIEDNSYTFEIETNGTISCEQLVKVGIDQFNISLKLKSSNQEEGYDSKRIDYNAIKSYPASKSIFKFVINNASDMEEILPLHKEFPAIPIYLMPQGTTRDDIIKNSPAVIELCLKYNFIYSPREHILLFNNQRGK